MQIEPRIITKETAIDSVVKFINPDHPESGKYFRLSSMRGSKCNLKSTDWTKNKVLHKNVPLTLIVECTGEYFSKRNLERKTQKMNNISE